MKGRAPIIAALAVAGLLTISAGCASRARPAAEPERVTRSAEPALSAADRTRLAEAFRLAEALRDSIWEGWSRAPLAVLLVTPEQEFLLRHPEPTEDFRPLGYDSLLRSEVHVRPRQFPTNLLASFPAVGGVATIVIGQPEQTGLTSTAWVLTLLHEHFHQLQYIQPDYYAAVAALDLSDGDETGMWMLEYPFPYDSAVVQQRFAALTAALSDALEAIGTPLFPASLAAYHAASAAFRRALPERDYRYFAFQLWQEGVARYAEYRIAALATERHAASSEFRALPDYTPVVDAAAALRHGILDGTRTADLATQRRVAFYPVGAATALLLDAAAPGWQAKYFSEMFSLDAYFDPPTG